MNTWGPPAPSRSRMTVAAGRGSAAWELSGDRVTRSLWTGQDDTEDTEDTEDAEDTEDTEGTEDTKDTEDTEDTENAEDQRGPGNHSDRAVSSW
jgi:hypothetical protein